MKHVRQLVILLSLAIPIVYGGRISAAPQPITQELHVTATVPDHRDIIINTEGEIIEITSNTPRDVMPSVYLSTSTPANKAELTQKLYEEYRQHVPIGTAKYGVLYKQNILTALLNVRGNRS
ncbi:MAG: hypothetical protein JWP13_256 [Candidatus Saccharibacteria bacterium]|nr:hypothetical protein [Candidatus Saccharibacteria bacterium]